MHAYASLAPTHSRTETLWTACLCFFLTAAALVWLVFSYGYIEDDAYIHLEFARSIAEGHGFSFNGRQVNGDTAPLWVVFLVAIHPIGFTWMAAAKFLCGTGVLTALSGVWRVASDIAGAAPPQSYLPIAALVLTAVNP